MVLNGVRSPIRVLALIRNNRSAETVPWLINVPVEAEFVIGTPNIDQLSDEVLIPRMDLDPKATRRCYGRTPPRVTTPLSPNFSITTQHHQPSGDNPPVVLRYSTKFPNYISKPDHPQNPLTNKKSLCSPLSKQSQQPPNNFAVNTCHSAQTRSFFGKIGLATTHQE